MIYAPVLIPTLNRYNHFRQCLDSLECCTGARQTEVYVAVDYPPSEQYVNGWEQIKKYLLQKEKSNKFLKLHVILRDCNYGVLRANSNLDILLKEICENYDRYIISEDDNVFSRNFLQYINKGLERFEQDPTVLFICGYSQPYDFKHENNNHFFHRTDFSAWGYGAWTNKTNVVIEEIKNGMFPKTFSLANYFKVRRYGLNRLQQYMSYVLRRYGNDVYFPMTDCAFTSYIIINNKYVVNPTISKVRNIGWDVSGNSFSGREYLLEKLGEISQRHFNQRIDDSFDFEYIGDPNCMSDYNDKLTARISEAKISWSVYVQSLSFMLMRYIARKILGESIVQRLKLWLNK